MKQKNQLQWFKDGDTNSKYFNYIIRGRRRKLFVLKIISEDGEWIHGEDDISQTSCAHFEKIFIGEEKITNEDTL